MTMIPIDFFNWNRVKVRYCDGASFSGDGQDKAADLKFRGHKIWLAAMEELMDQGMASANQALLSGCSAGGLASILRCDEFGAMFSKDVRVKCLSDAGFFLDALDVAGNRTLRKMFSGVVALQDVGKNLPQSCLNHTDPTSCFFPQNLIANVTTPLFILNAAYDSWQIVASLTTSSADPTESWKPCEASHANCNMSQILFLQDFRKQMISALVDFTKSSTNGVFLNSCFAHCQTELQDTWFAKDAPHIRNTGIAESVGNWYFDRRGQKMILGCPYPCDQTCHNQIMK